jgi:predicted permease
VLISIAGWLACFAIGVVLQRRLHDPHRLSHMIFMIVLWVLSPLVAIYAYTTVVVRAELLAAFACVIVATWTVLLAGMLWGRFGGREQRESGVMAFATGMGNTSTLGFPLTTLAFGGPGLALAVIYAEFQYLLPTYGVVLGLGRHYAGPDSRGLRAPGLRKLARSWLVNPPMIAGVAAVALRLLGVDISAVVAPVGPAIGLMFGLVGFLQIGLAISLEPLAHDRGDVWRTAVTIALRCGLMALTLLALGWLFNVKIPGVFLLLAAMPVAFNTLVVSAVFDLDRELARLLVAVSTPLVIAGALIWQLAAG